MSDLPPLYPPGWPGFEPAPPAEPAAAARKAAFALWLLGGFCLAAAVLLGSVLLLVPDEQLRAQLPQLSSQQQTSLGGADLVLVARIIGSFLAVGGAILGLMMVGSAAFVRRGRRAGIIIAMTACSFLAFWGALNVLAGLLALLQGQAAAVLELLFWIIVLGATVGAIRRLLQALKGAGSQQQQYLQAMFRQYQQQAAQGYGYGAPPPPPSDQPPP